jgi:lysophospholipase L1-like esterase
VGIVTLTGFFSDITPNPTANFWMMGDSKATGASSYLINDLSFSRPVYQWGAIPTGLAHGGYTTAGYRASIDADLAATSGTPNYVLINIGANDVGSAMVEATVKANWDYILDAIHAKWPNAWVGCMRVWRRGFLSNCNLFDGWLATEIAARSSWAHLGPDERVFLENGDDGATYTAEGIHPNSAGYALTATQWVSVIP